MPHRLGMDQETVAPSDWREPADVSVSLQSSKCFLDAAVAIAGFSRKCGDRRPSAFVRPLVVNMRRKRDKNEALSRSKVRGQSILDESDAHYIGLLGLGSMPIRRSARSSFPSIPLRKFILCRTGGSCGSALQ